MEDFVDIFAVSCDSAESDTNDAIGRLDRSDPRSQVSILRHVAHLLKEHPNIAFKINTVVCKLNFEEDMNELISEVKPVRWKVFQVLAIEGENQGPNARRQVEDLLISREQFAEYIARHSKQPALVVEDNDTMRDSYVLIDEDLCFLDNSSGAKVQSLPILERGVKAAFESVKFDRAAFERRDGAFYQKAKWSLAYDIEDTCQ
jgi:radical S-adenosyl methionine domain-containing protein 2